MCAHQSDASEQLVFSQASKHVRVFIQTTCTRHFSWKQMTGPTRRPETSVNLSRCCSAPTQKREIILLNKFQLLLHKVGEDTAEITDLYVMVTNVICTRMWQEGKLVGIFRFPWIYRRNLLFFLIKCDQSHVILFFAFLRLWRCISITLVIQGVSKRALQLWKRI
jgi:hypothetical protein